VQRPTQVLGGLVHSIRAFNAAPVAAQGERARSRPRSTVRLRWCGASTLTTDACGPSHFQ